MGREFAKEERRKKTESISGLIGPCPEQGMRRTSDDCRMYGTGWLEACLSNVAGWNYKGFLELARDKENTDRERVDDIRIRVTTKRE